MKTVPLRGKLAAGRVALVDDEDYDLVTQYAWHGWKDCRRPDSDRMYPMASIMRDGRKTTIRMHQVITGWPLTDHEDGDGLNNQRYNLRVATSRQNSLNSRPRRGRPSQFKGVQWIEKTGRWQATIRANGKTYALGRYPDEADAARAYDAKARELFGEFAWLNFPDDHDVPERPPLCIRHPEVSTEAILALRATGLSWPKIAKEVGMTHSGVRYRWSTATRRSA